MFERSAHLYDAIYSWKNYAAESRRLRELIETHRPEARTLLDVACGTGKHLDHLGRHFEVEGLDLDLELLAAARERLPGVTFHEADMTDFELDKTYDVITCLFSSIGYVRTRPGLERAFARLKAHLSGRGIVIVEPWFDPDSYIPGFVHTLEAELPDGKVVRMDSNRREGDVSKLELHYLVGRTDGSIEHFTESHQLGLFTRDVYESAAGAAGLELVEFDPEGLMDRGLFVFGA